MNPFVNSLNSINQLKLWFAFSYTLCKTSKKLLLFFFKLLKFSLTSSLIYSLLNIFPDHVISVCYIFEIVLCSFTDRTNSNNSLQNISESRQEFSSSSSDLDPKEYKERRRSITKRFRRKASNIDLGFSFSDKIGEWYMLLLFGKKRLYEYHF